jgi:surface carbohydrate biosynthesis protein
LFFKIAKLIKIIFISRITFFKPPKKKYIIFDDVHSEYIYKYLKKKNISILHTRNEEFNLFVIILNFIKFKFSKLEYYNTYIRIVDPKFLISFKDNDPLLFTIRVTSKLKKILIQNSWKNLISDDIINTKKFLSLRKFFNLNYFFSFNKTIGEKYKKISGCNIIPIGSFRSNSHRIINSKIKKKYDIMYISNFEQSSKNLKKKITKNITAEQFHHPQKELLKTLDKYSNNNKLKLYIYGRHKSRDRIKTEKEYYKKLLKKSRWSYIKNNSKNVFYFIDQSSLIITINSTLGYEAFSRKVKTVFFNIRPKDKYLKPFMFGWPCIKKKRGFFWIDTYEYKIVTKFLNKIIKCKQNKWENITRKYNKILMVRDNNNSQFKKVIFKKIQ